MKCLLFTAAIICGVHSYAQDPLVDVPYDRAMDKHNFTVFMKNSGWCWFQDPRAIVQNGFLITGAVHGQGSGATDWIV